MKTDFIITVDRSMMTNHHGYEFVGFMTTAPPVGLPEHIWNWISMPRVKVDRYGRPVEAPYGLRKIEAALQDAGFKAYIIDPDYIGKYIDDAKAILIGHHDYFALGPPSSEWYIITHKEPVNARSFRRFMESKDMKRAREKGLKFIVGGPAAWQWLWRPELIEKWKIDTIVDGEAERIVVKLAERILDGSDLPLYIYIGVDDTPTIDEIPVIKGASVNGLVEIMRGCPRGCKFCSVTLRPLRHIPLEKIIQEIEVNALYGVKGVILHSEDVMLYGSDGVIPREEPLLKLHREVVRRVESMAWSHVSLAAVKCAEERYNLVSKIMDIVFDKQDYIGVEVGIETGSRRLARLTMPAKAAPYDISRWPEIVEDAFRIMSENRIIPAATLIVGLPEEIEEDIIETIELVDRLHSYPSLIVPMYFVPMGYYKDKEWFKKAKFEDSLRELGMVCLKHDLYWADWILTRYYIRPNLRNPSLYILKYLLKFIIRTYRRLSKIDKWETVKVYT